MNQVEKFNLFRWFDTTTFGRNCINSVADISYKRTIYCSWIQPIKIHKWGNLRSLIPLNPEQEWTFSFDQFSHTINSHFHEYWWSIGEVIACFTKALWHTQCVHFLCSMWCQKFQHLETLNAFQFTYHVTRKCYDMAAMAFSCLSLMLSHHSIWITDLVIFHIFTIAFKWNWRQADMFSNLGEPSQTVSQFWQSSQFYLPKGANQPALWERYGRKNNWSCDLSWGFDFSK